MEKSAAERDICNLVIFVLTMLSAQSATGYFVQLGRCDLPFVYSIQTVRDGKGFCVRIVNVTQEEGKGICFSANCSFKLPDRSPIDWQERVDLREKYKDVLGHIKTPADLPSCPPWDTPW